MRCDNYCPRCGEPEESVTHSIFECPPALQAWSLSATPTSKGIFPLPSIYANMDYLFWRKNSITETHPYPWIIWYLLGHLLHSLVDMDGLRKVQFMGTWNQVRRETSLYSEVEALRWAMECMLQYSTCQIFGTDCKDSIAMINEPHA
uniref:Reverse transcriptase zinc-binding domain-containing protein n=1 Tax=Brassica oleracea TaxID=3712 RepID=A0A3P6DBZ0_BRAOL|nr:unnamed protein product [Brassica oleracea]